MEEKIYKVIKIIDDTSIVINAGQKQGIKPGDKFQIFEIGKDLKDPYTGENLGTLDTIKETITVESVLTKMCICRNTYITSYVTGLTNIMDNLTKINYQTLNVDTTQISGGLSDDLVIRIGDSARLIPRPINDDKENQKHKF